MEHSKGLEFNLVWGQNLEGLVYSKDGFVNDVCFYPFDEKRRKLYYLNYSDFRKFKIEIPSEGKPKITYSSLENLIKPDHSICCSIMYKETGSPMKLMFCTKPSRRSDDRSVLYRSQKEAISLNSPMKWIVQLKSDNEQPIFLSVGEDSGLMLWGPDFELIREVTHKEVTKFGSFSSLLHVDGFIVFVHQSGRKFSFVQNILEENGTKLTTKSYPWDKSIDEVTCLCELSKLTDFSVPEKISFAAAVVNSEGNAQIRVWDVSLESGDILLKLHQELIDVNHDGKVKCMENIGEGYVICFVESCGDASNHSIQIWDVIQRQCKYEVKNTLMTKGFKKFISKNGRIWICGSESRIWRLKDEQYPHPKQEQWKWFTWFEETTLKNKSLRTLKTFRRSFKLIEDMISGKVEFQKTQLVLPTMNTELVRIYQHRFIDQLLQIAKDEWKIRVNELLQQILKLIRERHFNVKAVVTGGGELKKLFEMEWAKKWLSVNDEFDGCKLSERIEKQILSIFGSLWSRQSNKISSFEVKMREECSNTFLSLCKMLKKNFHNQNITIESAISPSGNFLDRFKEDFKKYFGCAVLKISCGVIEGFEYELSKRILEFHKIVDRDSKIYSGYKITVKLSDVKGENIGRGGDCTVHEAILPSQKKCALKLIDKPLGESKLKIATDKFENEIKLLMSADHENVMKLFCYNLDGHQDYFMAFIELCEKRTLEYIRKRLKRRFSLREKVRVLSQLCKGMRYLHEELRIIHRDLKWKNVLFDADYNVKIIDFGISTENRTINTTNVTGFARGTAHFIAPECVALFDFLTYESAKQSGVRVTNKIDVYSFGIMGLVLIFDISDYSKQIYKIDPKRPEKHVEQVKVICNGNWRPEIENEQVFTQKIEDRKYEKLILLMKRCYHFDPSMRPPFDFIEKELDVIASDLTEYEKEDMMRTHNEKRSGLSRLIYQYEYEKDDLRKQEMSLLKELKRIREDIRKKEDVIQETKQKRKEEYKEYKAQLGKITENEEKVGDGEGEGEMKKEEDHQDDSDNIKMEDQPVSKEKKKKKKKPIIKKDEKRKKKKKKSNDIKAKRSILLSGGKKKKKKKKKESLEKVVENEDSDSGKDEDNDNGEKLSQMGRKIKK